MLALDDAFNFCTFPCSYDKFKPYGFAIHGAIDGWSRKILWLKVASTNNHPNLIATYYLQTLSEERKVPNMVRSDHGTENTIVRLLQCYFRNEHNDDRAGVKSFLLGKSTTNQRIESWWSILRRQCSQYWINFFKTILEAGVYDDDDPVHTQCLRYAV